MYNNLIFTAEPFSSPKRVEKISKTLKEKLDDIIIVTLKYKQFSSPKRNA